MVSGRSYVEMSRKAKLPDWMGVTAKHMKALLHGKLTYTRDVPLRNMKRVEGRVAAIIRHKWCHNGHWIALEKKDGVVKVFDPQLRRPVNLTRFAKGAWRTYCVVCV